MPGYAERPINRCINMSHPNECVQHGHDEAALREDIARFESHLAHIGANDDSAYEKARIRTYEALLLERRTLLRQLITTRAQR